MTPAVVPQFLSDYGDMTRAAVGSFLKRQTPQKYLDELVADYPSRGGKMMRPSLCIATAKAFGARLDEVIETASAIELLHNALLIHDDIQDESETRRGQPTLHLLHGVPLAINAGDTLSLLSLKPLLENQQIVGPRLALRIFDEAQTMARESAEGQAAELGWRYDNEMGVDDAAYLTMVLKKTCWLATIFPCRVGAMIGRRSDVSSEAFVRFGFFLGAAFQIQDDVLNLLADKRYGKEFEGDLWEGKRTLMLIHLYEDCTSAEKDRLSRIYGLARERKSARDIQWIRQRMDACGALDYACEIAHGLAGAALAEFDVMFREAPESADKDFVKGLVTWVFERI